MVTGAARLFLAFSGTAMVFVFWVVLFPACIMVVTLYICRLIPLTGWRQRTGPKHLPVSSTARRT